MMMIIIIKIKIKIITTTTIIMRRRSKWYVLIYSIPNHVFPSFLLFFFLFYPFLCFLYIWVATFKTIASGTHANDIDIFCVSTVTEPLISLCDIAGWSGSRLGDIAGAHGSETQLTQQCHTVLSGFSYIRRNEYSTPSSGSMSGQQRHWPDCSDHKLIWIFVACTRLFE